MDHKLHNEHLFYRKNLELQNSKNTHLSNLNTKIDSQGVIISGNTSSDGSGLKHAAHVNANGQLHTTLFGAVQVVPHNTLDGEGTPSTSVNVKNANITKGNSATAAGAEMQQVLIYGKKSDNTLQPLECSGDRLLVDVVELAASGKISTSTALSSVQMCGFDEATARFKTLKVDSNGKMQTECNRDAQAITTDSGGSNLSGSLGDGTATASCDLEHHKHIHFLVSGATNLAVFTVEGSHDNVTFYPVSDIPPSSVGNVSVHLHKIREATYRYYRLKNVQGMGSFTFSNMIFTKLNL